MRGRLLSAGVLTLLLLAGAGARQPAGAATVPALHRLPSHMGRPAQAPAAAVPALLVYDSAQDLLAGDLEHSVSLADLQAALAEYPPDWPIAGVGTTNQPLDTGEIIVEGTAGSPIIWWADPNSASQAAISDLTTFSAPPLLPFVAAGIGDPGRELTLAIPATDNVHAWLIDHLNAAGIQLAAIRLTGSFGDVATTVSYNLPSTGVNGYSGPEYFHMLNYAPAEWVMDGIFAAPAPLAPLVASGSTLHLHGYQPDAMVGGHIGSASAISVTATIWPLDQLIDRRGTVADPATPQGTP